MASELGQCGAESRRQCAAGAASLIKPKESKDLEQISDTAPSC